MDFFYFLLMTLKECFLETADEINVIGRGAYANVYRIENDLVAKFFKVDNSVFYANKEYENLQWMASIDERLKVPKVYEKFVIKYEHLQDLNIPDLKQGTLKGVVIMDFVPGTYLSDVTSNGAYSKNLNELVCALMENNIHKPDIKKRDIVCSDLSDEVYFLDTHNVSINHINGFLKKKYMSLLK